MPTIIEHVLSLRHNIGLTDVFGVPGDFSFPINDGISADRNLGYDAEGWLRDAEACCRIPARSLLLRRVGSCLQG
jgi:TPP-dependent 2-oxoacid decarboxylase